MHQFSNKKRLQKSLFSLIIIAFSTVNAFAQFGQETVEARVNVIRQKFKIANAAMNYEVITVDTCRFFLQNDTIKKMVKRVGEDELYEFYVDYKKEQYQPYFIFHQYKTEDKTWQNRYYFHEGNLIKWIDKDKEVVDAESVKFYCKNIDINGVFQQMMIDWENQRLNIPFKMFEKIEKIDRQVAKINVILKDTLLHKKEVIEEFDMGGEYGNEYHFFYQNSEKIVTIVESGADHGSSRVITYFTKGQIILKSSASYGWGFHAYKDFQGTIDDNEKIFIYYEDGKQFLCIKNRENIVEFREGSYSEVILNSEYSFDDCY